MFRWISLACSGVLLATTCFVLSHRFGAIPPLGAFLSPFDGIWVHAEKDWQIWRPQQHFEYRQIKDAVSLQYDSNQVVHIFAENPADLYFAQGWATARDRLWQMDFSARLGQGRLSQVVGEKGLALDRLFVRLQIEEVARKSLELIRQDPRSFEALQAYSEGVNAYLKTLDRSHWPLEFKILDYEPEPWSPLKSVVIAKLMTFQLSAMSSDLKLSRSALKLTQAQIDELFPYFPFHHTPFARAGQMARSRLPKSPNSVYKATRQELSMPKTDAEGLPSPQAGDGSNGWGVSGEKTKTGYPMIAGDLHLGYTVPSLWYQVQLAAGDLNVYGVSIVGLPGVVVGFNESMAWTPTNGYADVMDWYAIEFRDANRDEYRHDNRWRPTQKSSHLIEVRGGATVEEKMISTHHGPIVFDSESSAVSDFGPGLAVRWIGHEPSNELATFMALNRARSVSECWAALEKFSSPQQNFICADNKNNLGILQAGRVPLKWHGQGRLVADGRDSNYDWQGWLNFEDLPANLNPQSHYVFSANQNPVPESYKFYLGWDYPSPFRAERISVILEKAKKLVLSDFEQMQSDSLDLQAQLTLPALLASLRVTSLPARVRELLKLFDDWDYRFTSDSVAATIYDHWWTTLSSQLWSQRLGDSSLFAHPRDAKLAELVSKFPKSSWFDDPSTGAHETLSDWAHKSLMAAIHDLHDHHGIKMELWRWGLHRPTSFRHLAKIPGLGLGPLALGGDLNAIFANRGDHGPVWRMAVELGPRVQGRGIYPGGQSGNPGSRHYDDFLEDWRNGRLRDFIFLLSRINNDERITKFIYLVRE